MDVNGNKRQRKSKVIAMAITQSAGEQLQLCHLVEVAAGPLCDTCAALRECDVELNCDRCVDLFCQYLHLSDLCHLLCNGISR